MVLTAMFFAGCGNKVAGPEVPQYSAVVNYDLSLTEMIADGEYDGTDNIGADNFSIEGKGQVKVDFILVLASHSILMDTIRETIPMDTVLKELDYQGLRPATIAELLSFGAKYPDEQRKYPIVALGSVGLDPDGGSVVAVLCKVYAGGRELKLYYVDGGWFVNYRYLAVRK